MLTISFLVTIILVFTISFFISLYFEHNIQEHEKWFANKSIHHTLTNLLVPSIRISDTNTIRRILDLASTKNEIYGIVDRQSDLILPDYGKEGLFNRVISREKRGSLCDTAKSVSINSDGATYNAYCSNVYSTDIDGKERRFAKLISISKKEPFSALTSDLLLYFIIFAIVVILLVSLIFHYILSNYLMNPLLDLGKYIKRIYEGGIGGVNSFHEKIRHAPKEVLEIKKTFEDVFLKLEQEFKARSEIEKKVALGEVSAKVAHDIRSPLSVMQVMLNAISKEYSSKEVEMLKLASQRVGDIANNLLHEYRSPGSSLTRNKNQVQRMFLPLVLESIIAEKKHEWKSKLFNICYDISVDSSLLWVKVSPSIFYSCLSNLLNNAYEALDKEKGSIIISTFLKENLIEIVIEDNGVGMSSNAIDDALSGESSKHLGKGLGLLNAKTYIESIPGSFDILSEAGVGTKVKILLPLSLSPSWFPSYIPVIAGQDIIIIDDDISIHAVLKHKFTEISHSFFDFYSVDEFFNWLRSNKSILAGAIIFCDYDLGSKLTGGDIFKKVGKVNQGYMVTSHADNTEIQDFCFVNNIYLIPKLVIGEVPIKLLS